MHHLVTWIADLTSEGFLKDEQNVRGRKIPCSENTGHVVREYGWTWRSELKVCPVLSGCQVARDGNQMEMPLPRGNAGGWEKTCPMSNVSDNSVTDSLT